MAAKWARHLKLFFLLNYKKNILYFNPSPVRPCSTQRRLLMLRLNRYRASLANHLQYYYMLPFMQNQKTKSLSLALFSKKYIYIQSGNDIQNRKKHKPKIDGITMFVYMNILDILLKFWVRTLVLMAGKMVNFKK